MSNLLTGIASQGGLLAQGSSAQPSSQSAKNAEGNTAQLQIVQRAVTSGAVSNPAVVVSLSKDGKARAASYGEGRSVDKSFEKQSQEEKGGKDGDVKKKTVDVSA